MTYPTPSPMTVGLTLSRLTDEALGAAGSFELHIFAVFDKRGLPLKVEK